METGNFSKFDIKYPLRQGMRVFVYRNLNRVKKGSCPMFSIQSRENLTEDGFDKLPYGRVFHHSDDIILHDCSFSVQMSGWRKVKETGVKNVHAGVVGTLMAWTKGHDLKGERVFYNPHSGPCFRNGLNHVVDNASKVRIHGLWGENGWKSAITAIF